MDEIGQLKEGIVLVAVIIAFILVFQLFGYLDKKSKHSSVNDEITQEELWNPPDKIVDETVIRKTAPVKRDSVSSSGTSTTNTFYHPLTPDEKRALDQKQQQEAASKKAGW